MVIQYTLQLLQLRAHMLCLNSHTSPSVPIRGHALPLLHQTIDLGPLFSALILPLQHLVWAAHAGPLSKPVIAVRAGGSGSSLILSHQPWLMKVHVLQITLILSFVHCLFIFTKQPTLRMLCFHSSKIPILLLLQVERYNI